MPTTRTRSYGLGKQPPTPQTAVKKKPTKKVVAPQTAPVRRSKRAPVVEEPSASNSQSSVSDSPVEPVSRKRKVDDAEIEQRKKKQINEKDNNSVEDFEISEDDFEDDSESAPEEVTAVSAKKTHVQDLQQEQEAKKWQAEQQKAKRRKQTELFEKQKQDKRLSLSVLKSLEQKEEEIVEKTDDIEKAHKQMQKRALKKKQLAQMKQKKRKVTKNVQVQVLNAIPQHTEIPKNISKFKKKHFYGSRLNRIEGYKLSRRIAPATVFVTKSSGMK